MRKTLPLLKLFVRTPVCSQKTSSPDLASIYVSSRAGRRVGAPVVIAYEFPVYLIWAIALLHLFGVLLLLFSSFSLLFIFILSLLLVLSYCWIQVEIHWLSGIEELCFDRNGWALLRTSGEKMELSIPNGFAVRPFVSTVLIVLPVQERGKKPSIYRRVFPRALLLSSIWVKQEDLRRLRVLLLSSSIMSLERESS